MHCNSYHKFLPHNSIHQIDHLDPLSHSFSLQAAHSCLHSNLHGALGLGTCKNGAIMETISFSLIKLTS